MPGQYKKPESFCVMLRATEAAEADRIFKALAEGGTVQIPIAETFWALRFGKVLDQFGVPWLVNCEKPAEGERRVVINLAAAEFQQRVGTSPTTGH
jgi:PhnB protein